MPGLDPNRTSTHTASAMAKTKRMLRGCALIQGLWLAAVTGGACSEDNGAIPEVDTARGLPGVEAGNENQATGGGVVGTAGAAGAAADGQTADATDGVGTAAGAAVSTGGSGDPTSSGPGMSTAGTPPVTGGSAGPRVDNPYANAQGYVNPEWQAKAMMEPGGERIANMPTAVWLDRIAAIAGTANSQSNGPMGVQDHLDAALAQGAQYIQFVIYNLPGRDCAALASNGELGPDELERYKSEYIDPIVAIMGQPAYAGLRIINIIEVDSLPNLITNLDMPACAEMQSNGGYVQGVAYALSQLGALPNTYNYVDAGHHGWLGWDDNFRPAAQLFAETAKMAGMSTVAGFITNTANYSALTEPYLDPSASIGGQPLRMANWLDWNPYAEELTFAQSFREELVGLGFDPGIGMLIDTSRNGWGGAQRPTGPSTATEVNAYVEASRIDRRIHAGNWCNQEGAGLGERPTSDPAAGIDAYVWIKPPGESDGSSAEIANNDGKGFDRMCDPTYGGNQSNGNSATGALPDAPISGAWFSAQFQELMQNAHPPL